MSVLDEHIQQTKRKVYIAYILLRESTIQLSMLKPLLICCVEEGHGSIYTTSI